MRVWYGIDDAVAEWVAVRIPHVRTREGFGPYTCMGIATDAGQRVGGIVWHGYKPDYATIELSAAADSRRWLTRAVIREIFSYPFQFLNLGRVTTITPSRNRPAIHLNVKLGFQLEGIVRRGFGDDDAIVMGLLREEWLEGRWGPGPVSPRYRSDFAAILPSMELH